MEQKNYVSYEVAKLLKEKGFNCGCHMVYDDENSLQELFIYGIPFFEKNSNLGDRVAAPHLYDAQKWLREEQGISVEPNCTERGWMWQVCRCDAGHEGYILAYYIWAGGHLESYQDALNAGIREALSFL